MASAARFQYVNASEIPMELRCPVCTNPWVDPVEASCGDIFCSGCVPKDDGAKCPTCGAALDDKGPLRAPSRQLINMAERLLVKCTFTSRGCAWEGKRSELAQHTEVCEHSTERPAPKPRFVDEGKIEDEFICSICHEPWTQPVQHTACDNVFCSPCIKKSGVADCPLCRGALTDDNVRPPARQLLSMRARLPVYCANQTKGCAWQGPEADFEKHFAACTFFSAKPSSKSSIALTAKTEFPCIKTGDGKTVTMLHLDAPEKPLDEKRKPVNVSAVIDISGSMEGDKLRLAKETMSFVVNELTSDDILGLIAFDDRVEEVMPSRRMDAEGKAMAQAAIASLQSRGSTNLSGGLFAGIDQARGLPFAGTTIVDMPRRMSKKGSVMDSLKSFLGGTSSNSKPTAPVPASSTINAVWLFTDGQANAGICEPQQLVHATKEKLSSHPTDVTTFTFGFGTGHNADLLKAIAETSDGSYYYIENTETMKESFADCLGGLMSVVAQNIKVVVQCAPGVTIDRLMTSYTNTVSANTAEVTLKDLYSEEKRDILLSLNCSALAKKAGTPLATWTVSCLNAITGKEETLTTVCKVNVEDVLPAGMKVDPDVDEQRNRFLATEAMEAARREAEQGRMKEAQERLSSCLRMVQQSETKDTAYVQQLQCDMMQAQMCTESVQAYQSSGSKAMAQMAWGHGHQRCNRADEDALYENKAKKAMKGKSKGFF